ncbi:MAG: 6-carboxytetrahydropterin synthase [Ignavibacteriae bacterium]|nr:MAG: 6-carboxytetrahydropterin synthase [Ignavibacteriota bacterium]
MVFITRKFHFSASHRLYDPALSNEESERIYGKCSNPNGHGHNYMLEVTVAGEPDVHIGYVMDLKELKELVNSELINKVDHKNLNLDVDFMKGVIPTAENIAIQFWKQIENKINNNNRKLYSVKLFETENNSVEYRGS